jgi:hypothetical protein
MGTRVLPSAVLTSLLADVISSTDIVTYITELKGIQGNIPIDGYVVVRGWLVRYEKSPSRQINQVICYLV